MKRNQKRKPLISALEPRILFDGAAVATAIDVIDNSNYENTNNEEKQKPTKDSNNKVTVDINDIATGQAVQEEKKSIVFVDKNVKDYQTIINSIEQNSQVHVINSFNDIKDILKDQKDIESLHIISHGSVGEITVGNDVLNLESIKNYDEVLNSIKDSMTKEGDLLLYGCNVASNGDGQEFINTLANSTQADVAASDDITGAAALGGDWDLEVSTGSIEAEGVVVNEFVNILDNDVRESFDFTGIGSGSAGVSKILSANLAGSGTGTLKIVANDVDYSQGERNAVYFKDANDSNEKFLGYLQGSDGVDSTTTFTNVTFDTGGTATIRIYGQADAWSYNIRSANFTTIGNAVPEFTSGTSASVVEDDSVNITVSGKDGLTLNDNVTLSLHKGPSHGTILGFSTQSGGRTASDTFIYKPNADYNGSDYVIFKLSDGIDTVYQTINITVSPVADIVSDSIRINEDSSINYNLLSNDSFEGNKSISSVTQGTHGNVNIINASTGEVKYTPRTANWYGTDSFTYTVLSGGKYETTTVNVTVNPVNDAPTLNNVTKTLTDTSAKDTFANITGNLTTSTNDIDDNTFTYDFSNGTSSQVGTYGTLSISSSGAYTYVANANAINALSGNASDIFTIRTTDSGGGAGTGNKLTDTASFTVNITGTNDAPTIQSTANTNEYTETGNPIVIATDITINDVDNTTISSAIVKISNNFTTGDILAFANDNSTMGNIQASYNATTGVLTLSSSGKTATLTQWETALESIKFSSTNIKPNSEKTITWEVVDEQNTNLRNTDTTKINIKEIYTEQESNYNPMDNKLDLDNFTGDYTGKYIEFDISNSSTSESLKFVTTSIPSTINNAISIVGTSVFLGDGTNAKVIGQVDGKYNGENGEKLRINFAVGFENADFEIGKNGDKIVTGWTFGKEKVVLGTTKIGGFTTPDTFDYPSQAINAGKDNYTASRNPAQNTQMSDAYQSNDKTSNNTDANNDRDLAILLDTGNIFINKGYGIIRGPYVISDSTVSLVAGDKIAFDWKALAGGDAYAAYGYLLNTKTGQAVEILDDTGKTPNSETPWRTTQITMGSNQAGEYKFVFIAGSYDRTGGRLVGGKLMIDNVVIKQTSSTALNNNILEKIAQKVVYADSSDLSHKNETSTKTINIKGQNKDGNTFTKTSDFDKKEINDQVVLNKVNEINYVDTDGIDSFSNKNSVLKASDVDSGTNISYDIDGGTTNGNIVTKVGEYGTLTLDKSTGAYTYSPDSSTIDALSNSTSENFTFTVSDNNPNGTASTDSQILKINITAVNDAPLLGGGNSSVIFTENGSSVLIDPTITIDDLEGSDYDNGHIFIKNTANGQNSDNLVIKQVGGISISGSDIYFGSTKIATLDSYYDGKNGNGIKLNLNSSAYSVQVEALVRAVGFINNTDDISTNARTYEIQVNDGGEPFPRYSTKSITVNINAINDLPVISLDDTNYEVEKVISTNPDGTLNLSGISFSDADDTIITVKLETTQYGTLTVNDSVANAIVASEITNNGTQTVTITSTIDKINTTLASLSGLKYVAGDGNDAVSPGLDSLKITAIDTQNGQDISSKTVTVLPAVPNAFSDNILEKEDVLVKVDLESLVDDVNGSNRTFTFGTGKADITDVNGNITTAGNITPLDASKQIKDNNKLIGYELEFGKLILAEGTLEDTNFVAQFVYTPNDENWSGSETFVYKYTSSDANKESNIAQINIFVSAVNDAPIITLTNGTAETINEDNSLVFSGNKAITLADVDSTGSETFDINLSVTKGILELSGTTGLTFLQGSDASGSMKLRGTLSDLQSAIDSLKYTPNSEYNGIDSLKITFDDRGNVGAGNVLQDTKTIAITINAIDDAPIIKSAVDINITDTSGVSIIKDSISNFIKASDVDSSNLEYIISNNGSEVQTQTGTYGTLTLDKNTGEYIFTPNISAIQALDANTTESFILSVTDGTTKVDTTININITAAAEKAADYVEQAGPTLVLEDTSIKTNGSYAGGYIDFDISSSQNSEIVGLAKDSTPSTIDGAISIVGTSVFLGDGTNAKVIGQVDGKYNGENGEKLRINFAVGFENADFEIGKNGDKIVTGWTFGKEKVVLGKTEIGGFTTPDSYEYPASVPASKDDYTAYRDPKQNAQMSNAYQNDDNTSNTTSNDADSDGDLAILLDTGNTSIGAGYGIIRGPYVISDSTVSLVAGDKIAFDWKALSGGDAYAAYGYLLNTKTGETVEILDKTGNSHNSETPWTTTQITMGSNQAGEYKFVFIAGSYDRTGGRYVGGKLMIDNVVIKQANSPRAISSDVLEKIAKKVTYENTNDLTSNNNTISKTITITTQTKDGINYSDTKALDIKEVNDLPTLSEPSKIYYTDTKELDDFEDFNANLVASDVDSGTTLSFSIANGTDNGSTYEKVGEYGTLTLNKSTGEYTFTPNDSAINALSQSQTETFVVSVNDGDGGTASKTITVDIQATNDGPILGGASSNTNYIENSSPVQIDPSITITDPEVKGYDKGSVRVSITQDGDNLDNLSFQFINGISRDGLDIKFASAVIGTIDSTYDGTNGKDLLVHLNQNAYSAEVQALIRALSYDSSRDSFTSTSRTISIEVNDGGDGGKEKSAFSTKEANITITPINDVPIIELDDAKYEVEKVIGSNENGNLYLTGIQVSDLDETGNITVVLETTNSTNEYGNLTVKDNISNGLTSSNISNNGTKSVTLTGTIAQINATLAHTNGLEYVAGSGNDSVTPGANNLKITVTDSQNGVQTSSKEVIVLPAVPNVSSQNIIISEDNNIIFDISELIKDINDNSGSYNFGTVGSSAGSQGSQGSLVGFDASKIITVDTDLNGDGDTDDTGEKNRQVGYELTNGKLILDNDEALGSDFARFIFIPNENWSGTETLYYQYISGDGKTSEVSTVLFYVKAVNDAPTITANATQTVNEDTSISFNTANNNTINIDDIDILSNEQLELTLDVSKGKLTLGSTSNISFLEGTDNSAHIKIKGTKADLQNALDSMSYLGNSNYYGNDFLEIKISDLGNIGNGEVLIDTKTIELNVENVNDAPTIEIAKTQETIKEDGNLSLESLITFSDVDSMDKLTVSETTKSITATTKDNEVLNLTATQIQDIEEAFKLNPYTDNTNTGNTTWEYNIANEKLDFLAVDETVTVVYTITVTDDNNTKATQDVTITITGTNDAPTIDVPTEQTKLEDVNLVFSTENSNAIITPPTKYSRITA